MRIPRLLVVADSAATAGRPVAAVVGDAVRGGARVVWAREKSLPVAERLALLAQLADLVHAAGGALLASPGPGSEVADGYHVGAGAQVPRDGKPFGRSCHGGDELERAAAEGCSWATLSPVFASASKPGHGPALGLAGLARLVAGNAGALPVLALGGVDAGNASGCIDAGAAGVAVMGAVMSAPDVAGAVERLLRTPGVAP